MFCSPSVQLNNAPSPINSKFKTPLCFFFLTRLPQRLQRAGLLANLAGCPYVTTLLASQHERYKVALTTLTLLLNKLCEANFLATILVSVDFISLCFGGQTAVRGWRCSETTAFLHVLTR